MRGATSISSRSIGEREEYAMRPRLNRLRRGAAGGASAPPAGGAARTSGWTAGRSFVTRLQALLAWGAICCGPAALIMHAFASQHAPIPASPAPRQEPLTLEQQAAGAHALGFVGAWLSATRDDSAGLEDYLSGATVAHPVPREYRDLSVASIQPDHAGGTVTVVICGRLREESDPAGAWLNRCFQIAIAIAGGGQRVLGMPAQIAPPPAASAQIPYRELRDAPQIAQTVQLFLTAYLSGSPDLERFTAPESGLRAIEPGPYAVANLRSLAAAHDPPQGAPEGASLRVMAAIEAESAAGRIDAMSYWLSLRVRDGRWEIVSIDAGPAAEASSEPAAEQEHQKRRAS